MGSERGWHGSLPDPVTRSAIFSTLTIYGLTFYALTTYGPGGWKSNHLLDPPSKAFRRRSSSPPSIAVDYNVHSPAFVQMFVYEPVSSKVAGCRHAGVDTTMVAVSSAVRAGGQYSC